MVLVAGRLRANDPARRVAAAEAVTEAREAYLSLVDHYLDWSYELGLYVLFDGWHEGGQGNEIEQWEDIKDVISSTEAVFNINPSGSTSTVSLKPIEWQVLAQIRRQLKI